MRRPIFLACGTLFCHVALAQSSVTLYGLLDDGIVYVNHSSPTAGVPARKVFQMASSSESRWGFTGREDLGGGTQALFQLENGFNINSGALSEGGRLFGRQAIVGLQNPHMGQLTMGRDYDFGADYVGSLVSSKQWSGGMGAHVGDADNLYNSFRLNNTVKYTTPDVKGLVVGGAYAFSNQASSVGGAGFANDRAYTFGARYQNGPLVAAASYLQVDKPTAGNTGGNNPSGAVAGDYVNLRNIFYGPVTRQQVAASGANYTAGPFTAGLIYSWVKLSYADQTSLRLSNYEANGGYRFTPDWQETLCRSSRASGISWIPEPTSRFQRVRISSRAAASSTRSRRNRDTLDLPSFAIAMDCSSCFTSAHAACKATPRSVRRTILARVSVESGTCST
jgi:GBP family porin